MDEENKDREYIEENEEKVEKDIFDQKKYKHLWVLCENCENVTYKKSLVEEFKGVCPQCGETLLMTSSDRIDLLIDSGTWCPMDADFSSLDLLEKDKIRFFNIVTVREISKLFYDIISHKYYHKSYKTFKTLVGFNNTIVDILRVVIDKKKREYLTHYFYADSQLPLEIIEDIISRSVETVQLLMVEIGIKIKDEIAKEEELYAKIHSYIMEHIAIFNMDFFDILTNKESFFIFRFNQYKNAYKENVFKKPVFLSFKGFKDFDSIQSSYIRKKAKNIHILCELRQKLADVGYELRVMMLNCLKIKQEYAEHYGTFIDDEDDPSKNTDEFRTLREDVFHEIEKCYLHNFNFEIEKFLDLFEEGLFGVVKLDETVGSEVTESDCNPEKEFGNIEEIVEEIQEDFFGDYSHLYEYEQKDDQNGCPKRTNDNNQNGPLKVNGWFRQTNDNNQNGRSTLNINDINGYLNTTLKVNGSFRQTNDNNQNGCLIKRHYIDILSYQDYVSLEIDQKKNIIKKDTSIEDISYIEDIEDIEDICYEDYNDSYQKETGLPDAIQTGIGRVNGITVALGVMDFKFMGGSMGSVVGEKITRLIQHATKNYLPVIIVCASGGARMQEGSFSLMQMSKIAAALHTHQKEKNLLYISILTSPTTGGVTASFGMLANVTIVEPNAYIAFAGKRVIEQTLNQIVEEESQTSDSLFDFGMFDVMVPRAILKKFLSEIVKIITFGIEKSE
uniref:Acetyl-coenzyme A carboxylase carboxyl transferase subunit beta, chloroplastic n=1 Tax=Taxus globosa TaxID=156271 RepID=A0A481XAF8_9CONI|nr:acetyl-CoA carboxylase beta subunit [Taxus globosa]QBK36668.1 acetyl-CoA carboxylase beta subunit [Taxus globosa]